MFDIAKSIDAARFAVAEACHVCRRVQRGRDEVVGLLKDDKSPVTLADFASQAVVARALLERLGGGVRLVAEETSGELRALLENDEPELPEAVLEAVKPVWPSATMDEVLDAIDVGDADPSTDSTHGFWTLDPIDGTKGFLRGGQYAVTLAWVQNGSPVIGVLGCPNLSLDFGRALDDPDPHGSLYVAAAGDGVVESPSDDLDAKPLPVRRLELAEDEAIRMCESVESGHTSHDIAERVLEILGEPAEPARLDSQAKYAVVARGQADLYLRLPRKPKPGKPAYVERIWDHAAGACVAREAGCAVSDVFGAELDFGVGRGLERNRGVVVGPAGLHGRALGALERVMDLDSLRPQAG